MKFKVQGRDFSQIMTNIKLKLVRTYKGEIVRTQAGKVAAFPVSFITVGFDFEFLGRREEVRLLQQILLSDDLVEIVTDYDGTTIKGKFSCTANEYEELRDKNERSTTLNVSVVNDGSNITKENGNGFTITRAGSSLGSTFYFGKVYTLDSVAYKNGAKLPGNKILVLGDETLTSS